MKVLRLIVLLIHIPVILALLAGLLNAYIPPKTFGILNLISLGFPILMFFNILFCLFWIISWKKRAAVFLLLSVFLITPTRRWVNYSKTSTEASDLKVISFNIKNATLGKSEIETYLENSGADIILLQEATDDLNLKSYPHKIENYSQLKFYSKYPIKKNDDLKTNVLNGNSAFADIDIKGKTIRFINLYMEPFYLEKEMVKPTSDLAVNEQKLKDLIKRLIPTFKEHQTQLDNTMDIVNNSPNPVIFVGDFNAVPNSYEYYKAKGELQDVFLKVGSGSSTSFHDFKFPLSIDHIFISESIKPISYKVDRSVKISDHYPVIATFRIQ